MVARARQRAVRRRGEGARALKWLVSIITGIRSSSCIARCVDVPGSTQDCNMRGPGTRPPGLACGTHNALAVQSLQETPDAFARHHQSHLLNDSVYGATSLVLLCIGGGG